MAESGFVIATREYACPRCKAKKGEYCRSPKGRQTQTPHGERTKQLTKEDWDRCKVKSYTLGDILKDYFKEKEDAERKTVDEA